MALAISPKDGNSDRIYREFSNLFSANQVFHLIARRNLKQLLPGEIKDTFIVRGIRILFFFLTSDGEL